MSRNGEAWAPSNIALVKYWGKRNTELNLPAMGSLSVSLRGLETHTQVTLLDDEGRTEVSVDSVDVHGTGLMRVERMLSVLRRETGLMGKVQIESTTNFPVGAGIASSASGMAAIALAASQAFEWDVPVEKVSALARLGSGSACRSLFGGFVEWKAGKDAAGWDSHGVSLAPAEHWPLDVLVVVVDSGPKKVSSASGMAMTADSSPYYPAWVAEGEKDLEEVRRAVMARDFPGLATVAESSALKMHAAMMTGNPSILYWRPGSVAVLEWVEERQKEGIPCFFTMDAGPNVKIFFPPGEGQRWVESLQGLRAVENVLVSGVGAGAQLKGR